MQHEIDFFPPIEKAVTILQKELFFSLSHFTFLRMALLSVEVFKDFVLMWLLKQNWGTIIAWLITELEFDNTCTVQKSETQIGFDTFAFAFLIFQMRILHSWYFQHCMLDYRSEAVLMNRFVDLNSLRDSTDDVSCSRHVLHTFWPWP